RTAFVRLTQLLALGMKLFAQGLVLLGKTLADLLHLSLLVLSQIKLFEESTVAHSSPALSFVFTSTAMPFSACALPVVLIGGNRLCNGNRGSQSNRRESGYCQCLKPS